jgi:hypothetical protein
LWQVLLKERIEEAQTDIGGAVVRSSKVALIWEEQSFWRDWDAKSLMLTAQRISVQFEVNIILLFVGPTPK